MSSIESAPQNEGNNSFNTEATSAEKEARNKSIGHKVLEIVRKLFGREKQPKPDSYRLMDHVSPSERKSLKEICKFWDNCGIELPRDLGEAIENDLLNKKNENGEPAYWFGVHRSDAIDGEEFENDETLQSIMTIGLKNFGDASSGSIYRDPPVSKTVRPCTSMMHTVINLKGTYKGSTGGVLVAVPREYVDEDGNPNKGCEDKVYNHDGNVSIIKPEFLVGFVQNLGKGHTLQFKSRAEILNAAANKNQQQ